MMLKKTLIFFTVAVLVGAFFFFDGSQYLSLDILKQWFAEDPLRTALVYFGLYILVAGLSLPGAAIITLLGGAVFGLWWGVLIVSFASSLGATIAFLVSRILLADTIYRKFGHYLEEINKGVERDGAFYLFSLRLIPAVPFVAINVVFGLTKIKTWTFYWVSQLGMLAGTCIYVNAGSQLGSIEEFNASSILTGPIIGAIVFLIIFPFVTRSLVNQYRYRKAYKPYTKPESFDANLVVVGAGSAGLVSAYIAAAVKAKVVLIEKYKMGGDCLNTGCVPSKALIKAAKTYSLIKTANDLGIENVSGEVNFPRVLKRIHKVIETIEPHDSVERYTTLGVECVQGEATLLSPYEVKVGERIIKTKNIIIASGARPFMPPIPGLDGVDPLTSDNLWEIEQSPGRLLIMGAGPIGCELAQSFQRLGVAVTIVDMAPRIMPREDGDVSEYMLKRFQLEGVRVLLNQKIVSFEKSDNGYLVHLLNNSGQQSIECDRVLVAVSRKANTDHLGLEKLGIEVTPQGTVVVDEYLRTRFPNIYACGDVAGPYQFTHTAAHQAWYASVNALFGKLKKFRVDYQVIPWATFTDPEVARVGLSETEAQEKSIEYEMTRYDIDDLDRAIVDNEAKGFVKVLTVKNSDRIIGCTIVGAHAGELITEFVTAMKHNIGLNKILGTIHIYPTMSEANKYVAGEWKRSTVSDRTLRWLERFHHWMR
ncbi:dihydrolipoyl dehydrogenase [Candidatus Endobugula sertula]|uniref:Dihydrolipoyl dehydrogenase n=1 Tax=Candidatus Endobugula sertula TaxID=62101 RepID=A0A1D2QRU1_9GAMM|nr:dihydrolipoyl dehydrogenase [Candidatus Endobugula sertula]